MPRPDGITVSRDGDEFLAVVDNLPELSARGATPSAAIRTLRQILDDPDNVKAMLKAIRVSRTRSRTRRSPRRPGRRQA